jgi:hypothetical protein
MITKQALAAWLEDLPTNAKLAIEEGMLVTLHDANRLDLGEPPDNWCRECAGSRGAHRPDCAAWLSEQADQNAFRRVIPFRVKG